MATWIWPMATSVATQIFSRLEGPKRQKYELDHEKLTVRAQSTSMFQ